MIRKVIELSMRLIAANLSAWRISVITICCWLCPTVVADSLDATPQWSRSFGSSTYQVQRQNSFTLPPAARIAIAGDTNPLVIEQVQQQLTRSFPVVQTLPLSSNLAAIQQQALQQSVEFLFYYRLTGWHQGHWQRTEQCAQSLWRSWMCRLRVYNPQDQAQLTLWLFDVASQRLLDRVEVRVQSALLSGWNQSPSELLPSALQPVLSSYISPSIN